MNNEQHNIPKCVIACQVDTVKNDNGRKTYFVPSTNVAKCMQLQNKVIKAYKDAKSY